MHWELKGTCKNQGNIKQNFWELGSLVEANLGNIFTYFWETRNKIFLLLGNKGKCIPPPPPLSCVASRILLK